MDWLAGFRQPQAAAALREKIDRLVASLASSRATISIMEVCGTHTVAISKYGIRTNLPEQIDLISGPGCPVCVTAAGYVDAAISLAKRGVVIASFGDLLKVPGKNGTLAQARAAGATVEVCYSPLAALKLAKAQPEREVVFLAVGFETTIAPLVAVLDQAIQAGLTNLSFLTAFKTVPNALAILAADPEVKIDAFLCPAHVSAIIGARAYQPLVERFKLPCVIAGFEPLDILYAIVAICQQLLNIEPQVENQYSRVVKQDGNQIAQQLIAHYLEAATVQWRGLGALPDSGLVLRQEFRNYDAAARFEVDIETEHINNGCRCGEVLKGMIKPPACGLFGAACTPDSAVGPCMVSSEGTCAAYYKYSQRLVK